MQKRSLFPILLLLVFTSCKFNRTYLNDQKDKEDAVKVVDQFYNEIEQGNYDKVDALFSTQFWKVTTKERLHNILTKTNEKLGKLNLKTIADWKTKRVEGSNPLTMYAFVYQNQYKKFKSKESFNLIKEGNEVKILAYNITSDAFFQ